MDIHKKLRIYKHGELKVGDTVWLSDTIPDVADDAEYLTITKVNEHSGPAFESFGRMFESATLEDPREILPENFYWGNQ